MRPPSPFSGDESQWYQNKLGNDRTSLTQSSASRFLLLPLIHHSFALIDFPRRMAANFPPFSLPRFFSCYNCSSSSCFALHSFTLAHSLACSLLCRSSLYLLISLVRDSFTLPSLNATLRGPQFRHKLQKIDIFPCIKFTPRKIPRILLAFIYTLR